MILDSFENLICLFQNELLLGSLWPDFLDQGTKAVEKSSLKPETNEEDEHGAWDVVVPVLESVDLSKLSWVGEAAQTEWEVPVEKHVEWEHDKANYPPVRLLESHVSGSQICHGRDQWDDVWKDACKPWVEGNLSVLKESWPLSGPVDDYDDDVNGEWHLCGDVSNLEPSFIIACKNWENLRVQRELNSPARVSAE